MDSIDKLLKSLNNESSESQSASEVKPDRLPIDSLLKQIDAQPQAPHPSTAPSPDPLFDQLKQEHQETLRQEALRLQQQAQQKQERLEQLKQQRRQALAIRAEEWLKSLDPDSSEGQWFEEFACHYESRIVAAIDYFKALQEVDRD
ncbi:hypothetical protein [Leptolyngbya sp. FACHB-17]|uniref:salt stress protein, Slr1339 family n=1 Tax=unclassified Leptolyngbya TaxID=2650499 RepID=UPI001680268F|nr:hypothetical protein [Leptolyngbya sp. FACHB-17]MBD2079514.1 hypothetical protein [Leptolyngbya sp. FACHB-17]